jgi:hypothetical protein
VPTIEITRTFGPMRGAASAWRVVFDGSVMEKLWMGDSVEVKAPPGRHTLRMKVGWAGSNTIALDLSPDDALQFECEPGGPFLMAVVDLFGPTHWIRLRNLDVGE